MLNVLKQQATRFRPASARARASVPARRRRARHDVAEKRRPSGENGLPGWRDLTVDNEVRPGATFNRPDKPSGGLTHGRFVLIVLTAVVGLALYVGHVYAMQERLADMQHLEREQGRLLLKYNRLKGHFDQATSPMVIYRRARELGLEEGIEYGPAIHLHEE
jgi:hypothetical protein